MDAIGGSAAGCYSHNKVTWASLFRGVGPEDFEAKVRDMFTNIAEEWNCPPEVIDDGEVTALAGSMARKKELQRRAHCHGHERSGGYVDMDGNITTWPASWLLRRWIWIPRRRPMNGAATLAWVHSISRQAVARLLPASGIEYDASLSMPGS